MLIKNLIKSFLSFLFFVTAIILIYSCSKKNDSDIRKIIVKIMNEGSLNKTMDVGGFSFKCSFKPMEFLAYQDVSRNGVADSALLGENFSKLLDQYSHGLYFELTIAKMDSTSITSNVGSQQEYANLIGYLTYNMNNNFYAIVQEKDTIRCLSYNFINNYGLSPKLKFIFVFPDNLKNSKQIRLEYSDNLFGMEKNPFFEFVTADLKRVYLSNYYKSNS